MGHFRQRSASVKWLVFLSAISILVACQKSPQDELVEQTVGYVHVAVELLEAAKGNEHQLIDGLVQFQGAHDAAFRQFRKKLQTEVAGLNDEQKLHFASELRNRAAPDIAKLQLLAQGFPQPQRAMLLIRPLIIDPSPQKAIAGKQAFLPEAPEIPLELLGEAPSPTHP